MPLITLTVDLPEPLAAELLSLPEGEARNRYAAAALIAGLQQTQTPAAQQPEPGPFPEFRPFIAPKERQASEPPMPPEEPAAAAWWLDPEGQGRR